ncbi:MAG: hypothetical protein [Circular genetic element sp.]|nr:MAG: hypothetical protein [Circular genetic element sp.]
MVEYSFDRDEFFDRDPRGLFDRADIRQDMRDRDQEIRDLRAADELQRRADRRLTAEERRLAGFQDPDDDDMSRLKRDLERMPMEEMVELINNPQVMVTRRGISSRRPSGRDVIRRSGQFTMQGFALPSKKPRKKNKKHCKNLSQCLRQANAELRTKKGSLRKGKTQADIMRRAQKLLRKMK